MRLKGATSLPRDELLKLKWDAFQHMLRGLLTTTRMDYPAVRQGLIAYLTSQGLKPNDNSLMGWLQDNPGERVAVFMFEHQGVLEFLLASGTTAELRQIGEKHAEEGLDSQGSPRVRQVHLGEGARIVQPRRI